MFRLLKALPLTLALATLCLFAPGCSSGNNAQLRLIDAVANSPALDVTVNTTKVFSNITPGSYQPTPPAYNSASSGSDTLEALNTGSTSVYIANSMTSLSGSGQYTILMTGCNGCAGTSAPTFWSVSDNNTAPTTGNVEFRIINASVDSLSQSAGGLDIYIIPPGTGIQGLSPQVSGLTLGQGSAYQSLNFASSGYELVVTPHGSQNPFFNNTYQPPTGSIRTMVIMDSGNVISSFLVLDDLL